jgi:hypothetical protein
MLNYNGISERHALFGKMVGNPGMCGGGSGTKKKNTTVVSQKKSGSVGELPEATNESLCEDIVISFWKKDAFESLGGLRWVLPPTGRIPSFEGSTVAFSGSVAGAQTARPLLIL